MKRMSLSSSMGPGLRLDVQSVVGGGATSGG